MPKIKVFDGHETLLDLAALDPLFARFFGDSSQRRAWFNQLPQSAPVATVTDAYHDFGSVDMATLEMTAARQGISLLEDDRTALREGIRSQPAHPETRAPLERLRVRPNAGNADRLDR